MGLPLKSSMMRIGDNEIPARIAPLVGSVPSLMTRVAETPRF